MSVKIGVLALQGAFIEHVKMLREIENVEAFEVRTPEELAAGLDGLILPGGESTAIGLLAERWGLVDPLKKWIGDKKPIWGTCAGMILMANEAFGQKKNGQTLLGGLDVVVNRNHFGAQVASFECDLETSCFDHNVRALFIRAPGIVSAGKSVEVLAKYNEVIVAVKQANILATAFHPELTPDLSWHKMFVDMVRSSK